MTKSAAQWTVTGKKLNKSGGSRFTLQDERTGIKMSVTSSPKSASAIKTISGRYSEMFKSLSKR